MFYQLFSKEKLILRCFKKNRSENQKSHKSRTFSQEGYIAILSSWVCLWFLQSLAAGMVYLTFSKLERYFKSAGARSVNEALIPPDGPHTRFRQCIDSCPKRISVQGKSEFIGTFEINDFQIIGCSERSGVADVDIRPGRIPIAFVLILSENTFIKRSCKSYSSSKMTSRGERKEWDGISDAAHHSRKKDSLFRAHRIAEAYSLVYLWLKITGATDNIYGGFERYIKYWNSRDFAVYIRRFLI